MNLRDAFRTAMRSLRTNRMRSALTTLGIVIGIAAVIIGVALGNGVQRWFDELVGPLTTQIIVSKSTGHIAGAARVQNLTEADAAELRNPAKTPDVVSVTPVVSGNAVLRVREAQRRVTVLGAPADYLDAANRKLWAGRFVTFSASGAPAREIVLGPTPVAELFDNDPRAALGQQVRLARNTFTVVGVMTANSQLDDVAVMSTRNARTYMFGNDNVVNQIIVRASGTATVPAATAETTAVLDQRHHVFDPSQRDFDVLSLQTLIEQREQFLDALRVFIGAIAAIALIVGGIGVANIMLVSVTERTREIGLRKALGATRGEVLRQFLLESSMLSLTGGVAGMLVGVGLTEAAAYVIPRLTTNFPAPSVSPASVVISFAISALIGIVAGSYPAERAARMHPVDALRFQ